MLAVVEHVFCLERGIQCVICPKNVGSSMQMHACKSS